MTKREILRLIEDRTLSGRGTMPEHILREVNIDDTELKKELRRLYVDRYIVRTPDGWKSSKFVYN